MSHTTARNNSYPVQRLALSVVGLNITRNAGMSQRLADCVKEAFMRVQSGQHTRAPGGMLCA